VPNVDAAAEALIILITHFHSGGERPPLPAGVVVNMFTPDKLTGLPHFYMSVSSTLIFTVLTSYLVVKELVMVSHAKSFIQPSRRLPVMHSIGAVLMTKVM
jgi:hypothetical protein